VAGSGQPRPPLTAACPAAPRCPNRAVDAQRRPPLAPAEQRSKTGRWSRPLGQTLPSAPSAPRQTGAASATRLSGDRAGRRDKASPLPASLTPRPCQAPKGRGLQQVEEHLFITSCTSSRYEARVQAQLQPSERSSIPGFTLRPSPGAAPWQKLQDRCMAPSVPVLANAKASLPPTGQH